MLHKKSIPNLLTFARVAAVPVCFGIMLAAPRNGGDWLLAIFVAACLTDFLDGYLARRWQAVSALGALLDPIADKLLVALLLVYLLTGGASPPFAEASHTMIMEGPHTYGRLPVAGSFFALMPLFLPVVVILLRELYISGLREFLGARGIALPVSKSGKWKTTLQMLAIALLLVAHAYGVAENPCGIDGITAECSGQSPLVGGARIGGMVTLYAAATLAFTSAVAYSRAAIRSIRHHSAH